MNYLHLAANCGLSSWRSHVYQLASCMFRTERQHCYSLAMSGSTRIAASLQLQLRSGMLSVPRSNRQLRLSKQVLKLQLR